MPKIALVTYPKGICDEESSLCKESSETILEIKSGICRVD